MIIVVEGPDNSGKTTFALWLAKQLRAAFVKVERPKSGVDLMAFQNILEVSSQYSGTVVADRHVAISEPIYGTIIRGTHDIDTHARDVCLRRIHTVVYCRPPHAAIMSSIAERDQMEGVIDNSERIIEAYDRLYIELLNRNARVVRYDYTRDTQQEALQRITV